MIKLSQYDDTENRLEYFSEQDYNKENITLYQFLYKLFIFIVTLIIIIISFDSKKSINEEDKSREIIDKDKEDNYDNNKTDLKENNIYNGRLSIIINSFDINDNLVDLVKSILSKNLESIELIVATNYKLDNNFFENEELRLRKKNIFTKIIQYNKGIKPLNMKINSASNSTGDYIVFLYPEETLSLEIFNNYKNYIKENIDIIQYDLDYVHISNNKIIYQPQIFESLYFERDSFEFNHFHLNGKFYKNDMFKKAVININQLYLEKTHNYFDEVILINLLFKNAESFIKIQKSKSCNRYKCQKYNFFKINSNVDFLEDTILYLRFLLEITGKDKVQEKRMAAKVFHDLLILKGIKYIYNDKLLELAEDTINLYLKCELINEFDKNKIINYKNSINKNI